MKFIVKFIAASIKELIILIWILIKLRQSQSLFSRGQYVAALKIKEACLNKAIYTYGESNLVTMLVMGNLVESYFTQGLYNETESLLLRSLSIYEKQLGSDHPISINSLHNLAELYGLQGRYSEAEPFLMRLLAIYEKQLGVDHLDTASTLNSLAVLYYHQGRYKEAEPYSLRSLDIRRKKLEANHPDIAINCGLLAVLYQAQGRYSESESLYLQSLSIVEKKLGDDHLDTALTLNNLAGLYSIQGRYKEAESYFLRSLDIREKKLENDHPDISQGLNNLAALYVLQGKYSEVQSLLARSLSILERKLGADHPYTAQILNNLARLYTIQGKYSEAELCIVRSLDIRAKKLGTDHPDTVQSLSNLAVLYYAQGRYREAEPLLVQSISILEKQLGTDHPQTALSLNNLAELDPTQERAEPLFLQSLSILEKQLGANHPQIAISLNNLAGLYSTQGEDSKAEPLYLRSLLILEKQLGADHPDTAQGLNNLAGFYQTQGRGNEAESLYKQSLSIWEKHLGADHPNTGISLNNLALLYEAQGKYGEALAWMQEGLKREQGWLDLVFPHANDAEKLRYIDQIQYRFEVFLSLIYQHFLPLPKGNTQRQEAMIAGLDMTLNRKAITLTTAAALSSALYSGRYPELEADFQQLRQLQAEKSRLYILSYDDKTQAYRQQRLQEIDNQLRELEPKLAQAVPEFKLAHQTVDRQAISLKLPDDSTLIEFVRFRLYDFKAKSFGKARYVAFVYAKVPLTNGDLGGSSIETAANQPLNNQTDYGEDPPQPPLEKGEKIEMVDLGDAEELDYLIQTFREQITDAPLLDDLAPKTKPRETQPTKKLKAPDRQPLIEKLLNPLKPYLNTSNLILATDGLLNLLPLNLVGFQQTIRYLNSGRELLREDVHIDRPSTAPLILADPNFDYPHENTPDDAPIFFDREHSRICKTLGESVAQKLRVIPYLDNQALSSRLLQTPSPRILLIATHGHYEETTVHIPALANLNSLSSLDSLRDNSPKDLPMYRSFLAMTGANTGLRGEPLPPEAGNGLLSDQDITALDLWNTDLVVLCACQTGMGKIINGEGVFGLRRALAIAGAKTLIMSLWSVPALPTVLLMDRLFDALEQQSRKDYHAALKTAQDYIQTITVAELKQSQLGQDILKELSQENLLNGNPDQQPLQHPYFWAAWICQGS